ncbi:MAG: hypothetical protein A2X12_08990 [Bacteroidetes bacterium GWE2_29_8]|nr:MAG: hypothetical protein A2X12_08990 [Bacteroidetes bacterium GWE2_29_8]OFY18504.1 MAG: hypothetical protein A2X02_07785 [Bacteroidetes bacterium GWF2_29_10]
MKIKYNIIFLLIITSIIVLGSCKKEAGTGGSSSIYGKVYVRDYNSTYTVFEEEYAGQDMDVYIIYEDDKTFSERIRTNYDGAYEFKYLRKGNYHIYAYSEDSTLLTNAMIPIIKDVEVTKRKQVVEVPDIIIFK